MKKRTPASFNKWMATIVKSHHYADHDAMSRAFERLSPVNKLNEQD